jgi:hypothetical protein
MKSINSNIINQSNKIQGDIIKIIKKNSIWKIAYYVDHNLIQNLSWLTLYRDQIFRETLLKVYFGTWK